MKVTRAYLNKHVELVWRDPCSSHVESHTKDGSDLPRGRAVLAYQEEVGIIDDISDGVVRIRHTRGVDSPLVPDPTTAFYYTWVAEELIEKITVYEPVREEAPPV